MHTVKRNIIKNIIYLGQKEKLNRKVKNIRIIP
jgi:hypothetical protein